MGIPISAFEAGDVYIDFPYEEVMFRYDSKAGKVFCKFYGDAVEKEVDQASTLYADATIAGTRATLLDYRRGRPRFSRSISAFKAGDVYIDFPYEEVMFRYDSKAGKVFRKFYGESLEDEVDRSLSLYAEARVAGTQTTADEYRRGRPRYSK